MLSGKFPRSTNPRAGAPASPSYDEADAKHEKSCPKEQEGNHGVAQIDQAQSPSRSAFPDLKLVFFIKAGVMLRGDRVISRRGGSPDGPPEALSPSRGQVGNIVPRTKLPKYCKKLVNFG